MSCQNKPPVIGGLLGHCDHLVHMQLDRRLRCYGVTPIQCRSLLFLHDCGGAARQKELQEHLRVKASTVNGIVDRLEEKELLRRSPDRRDSRFRVLQLTEQSRDFFDDFSTITQEVGQRIQRGFTPEEAEQLQRLLLRVVHNLEDTTEEAEL